MYFSVIRPTEGLLRQAAHELAPSAYAEHQWLWRFFAGQDGQPRDFIFRRHLRDQIPCFYVVSQRAPAAFSEAWQVHSKPYEPRLQAGQRLAFQLCVNPVVSKKDVAGKSRRHDVVMQAKKQLLAERGAGAPARWGDLPSDDSKPLLYDLVQQTCSDWLKARARQHGFELLSCRVDNYRQQRSGKRDIQFSTVDFSGELLVTEPGLVQRALFGGLGHAKAFGCGLLLVKPAESAG